MCTAADLSGQAFPYHELRSVVLDTQTPRDGVKMVRWDGFDPGEGPVLVAATAAGKIARLAAADVTANSALYDPRHWVGLVEDAGRPDAPPGLPGWAPCSLAPEGLEPDPIVAATCGEVVSGQFTVCCSRF